MIQITAIATDNEDGNPPHVDSHLVVTNNPLAAIAMFFRERGIPLNSIDPVELAKVVNNPTFEVPIADEDDDFADEPPHWSYTDITVRRTPVVSLEVPFDLKDVRFRTGCTYLEGTPVYDLVAVQDSIRAQLPAALNAISKEVWTPTEEEQRLTLKVFKTQINEY